MSLRVGWFTDPVLLRYRRIGRVIPTKQYDYNLTPGSVWIRCLQLIPYLAGRGIHSWVNDPGAEVDICVFVRWQNAEAYQAALRQKEKGRRIAFDLAVNYFDVAAFGDFGVNPDQVQECLRMVSLADVVICGSAHIARRARDFHRWSVYIPESVNRRHFSLTKRESDFRRHPPRAIWSGYSPKANELEFILPLLQRRGIPLVVIAERKPQLLGPYRFIRWEYQRLPRQLLEGEFCVAPRGLGNPYDLGHSLFKVGIFMAQGVPALASPVPSYTEIMGTGKPGLLCHSLEDWEKAIDLVLSDWRRLLEWSQESIAIMEEYHTERIANRYVDLFAELVGEATAVEPVTQVKK